MSDISEYWEGHARRVASERDRLRAALCDLLGVIAADDLIPESVSYMRQAREALESAPSNPARVGRPNKGEVIGSAEKSSSGETREDETTNDVDALANDLPSGSDGISAKSSAEKAPRWTTHENGDVVCEHGTAIDVHCCGCHSGFLFDSSKCVCF